LTNTNTTTDATVTFKGNTYNVPAWSVSILPDCQSEDYNTAKVTFTPFLNSDSIQQENHAFQTSMSVEQDWSVKKMHIYLFLVQNTNLKFGPSES